MTTITPESFDGVVEYVSINTDEWLEERTTTDETTERLQRMFDRHTQANYIERTQYGQYLRGHWPEIIESFLERLERFVGPLFRESFNTYNHETDLDRVLQFWAVGTTDSDFGGDFHDAEFLILQDHRGGDVRGNYSAPRILALDGYGDCDWLDWTVRFARCDASTTEPDPNQLTLDGIEPLPRWEREHQWDDPFLQPLNTRPEFPVNDDGDALCPECGSPVDFMV